MKSDFQSHRPRFVRSDEQPRVYRISRASFLLFSREMQNDVTTITIDEESPFSFLLKEIPDPPKSLEIHGRPDAFNLLNRLPYYGLAVVGTRGPQPRSLLQIRNRLRELKNSSIGASAVIVSGLALGVDACAHEEALSLELPTIAVLGFGLDIFYPRENDELRKRIVESGGLLITEYQKKEQALPRYFIRRNRIIAGLAHATWIVEAGFKSGALNTATWARDHERKCFATPCFPGDPAFAGNQVLLSEHTKPTIPLFTAEDLSQAWLDLHSAVHPSKASLSKASLSKASLSKASLSKASLSKASLSKASLSKASLSKAKSSKSDAPRSNASGSRGRPGSFEGDSSLRIAETEPVELLRHQVALLTSQQGGAVVSNLFDWSLGLGWSPFGFYAALQKALESGLIQDRNGILVG